MKLTILGTGSALVTECYNTCYVLTSEEGHFLAGLLQNLLFFHPFHF